MLLTKIHWCLNAIKSHHFQRTKSHYVRLSVNNDWEKIHVTIHVLMPNFRSRRKGNAFKHNTASWCNDTTSQHHSIFVLRYNFVNYGI